MYNANGKALSDIIEWICEDRNIDNMDEFLNPDEFYITNPHAMQNMIVASDLFIAHMKNKIGILYDTDVDGLTSGTIIKNYCDKLNVSAEIFINKGKAHGLLQGDSLEKILESDINLLIIVDSLDNDITAYKKLADKNIDVIVLDHHDINPKIPYKDYITLVSSQQDYSNPYLSGAGVCLKFCMMLDSELNHNYSDELFDLAAIGILADVSNVKDSMENRAIINKGLSNINNPAIKKLIGSYDFNSKSVLFSIAPLINSSVRVNQNMLGVDFLNASDNKEILRIKKELEKCKELQNERKEEVLQDIRNQLESQSQNKILYCFISSDYGISGLLGNTLIDEYKKPIFIFNDKYMDKDDADIITGSMRSVGYDNFKDICNSLKIAKLDGHMNASGIVVERKNIPYFISKLNKLLEKEKFELKNDNMYDIEIDISDINEELVDMALQFNRISGEGFKPITFKVTGINEYNVDTFKDGKHLVLYIPNTNIMVIEWNTKRSVDEFEEHSIMNDEITAYCELEKGFMKGFKLKLIANNLEI